MAYSKNTFSILQPLSSLVRPLKDEEMGFKFKDEMGGCWDPFFRGFAVVLGRERRPLPVQTADLCALFRNIRMEESHEPPPGSWVFIGLKWLLTKPVDRLLTPTSFFFFFFPSSPPTAPGPSLRVVKDSGVLLPKLPEVEEAPEPPVGALDLGEDVRLGRRRRRPFGETNGDGERPPSIG